MVSHNSSRVEYMIHAKSELNSVKMRSVLISMLLLYLLPMPIPCEFLKWNKLFLGIRLSTEKFYIRFYFSFF